MKKIGRKIILPLAIALIAALCALFAVNIFGGKTVRADSNNPYSFYFEDYSVTYDVSSNRKVAVEEIMTIKYTGSQSTGFYKNIPVNAGEQVKNVKAYEIISNEERALKYYVETSTDDSNNSYVIIDIGDSSRKTGETHTYLLRYDYCMTRAQEGKDVFYLNAIGVDRDSGCDMKSATVTMILPDGYLNGLCYVGKLYDSEEIDCAEILSVNEQGRNVLTLDGIYLGARDGVSFKLNFETNALSTYSEFTPYWFVILAALILVAVIAIKFLCFNKNVLTPVVNFEAPDRMNPLIMGKLIDSTVNAEDITSMIFYWADKGYLKINLENKDDPVLIRLVRVLPEDTPEYEQYMFAKLFGTEDVVVTSSLKYRFYDTVQRVTSMVNSKVKGLHSTFSIGISVIFALIGGLLLGIAPAILGIAQISIKYISLTSFIALLPALVIYGLGETIKYYSLKLSTGKKIGFGIGIAAACAAFIALYALLSPSWIMATLPKIILCTVCCGIIICSIFIIERTPEYTAKLNDIVGFKNFILLVEKDKLEKMLEENPQFYYHVLPYAQVLGVSDVWENKFKGMTVAPPKWATSSMLTTYIELKVINSLLHRSMSKMASNMVARPSSSGSSGFGGGGVGGGHGGGGFHGR